MSSSTANCRNQPRLRAGPNFGQDENGAVLVELSLVAPLMLLLSAGVFEFSNILHTRLLIEAGVEDAARYMARCGDTWANCVAVAENLAISGDVAGGSSRVAGWSSDELTIASVSYDATDAGTGAELYRSNQSSVTVVQVSASYPYDGTGLWSYLGFGAINITASHQERMLGS